VQAELGQAHRQVTQQGVFHIQVVQLAALGDRLADRRQLIDLVMGTRQAWSPVPLGPGQWPGSWPATGRWWAGVEAPLDILAGPLQQMGQCLSNTGF
jgi:hypothetical protein